ncbi:L-threonine 3-dehydrogenase mitochondrial [Biomphalaria pfeifferi]|uniref:L-threonine 3-dehydrogenase mitochondrial n=1 Tax=Biomphalaria pfeifferi TaxID=112525 RepID=A0AAD8C345_BIOPF|nr:L-threonine 3-dehydrogenase mitochondrial [Biomphalaria pfeifferi]
MMMARLGVILVWSDDGLDGCNVGLGCYDDGVVGCNDDVVGCKVSVVGCYEDVVVGCHVDVVLCYDGVDGCNVVVLSYDDGVVECSDAEMVVCYDDDVVGCDVGVVGCYDDSVVGCYYNVDVLNDDDGSVCNWFVLVYMWGCLYDDSVLGSVDYFYYHTKFGLDFRCLRYPGVISEHKPGGGTTDYALMMFHDSVTNKVNICCLKPDTRLPMIYIDDLHHATVQYLQMPNNLLKKRTYNIGALDFSPKELALEIQKENPSFQVTYKPDYRQRIAETWPEKLDFSNAMNDWGYRPKYTLETACQKILSSLKSKLNEP